MTTSLPVLLDFDSALQSHRLRPLCRDAVTTLQVNVGKLCNQACQHCHVEAGPKRTERMQAHVAERVLELLRCSPTIASVDITGGAPELNPNFRRLVLQARRWGRHVVDRCNLTVLLEPGQEDLVDFLAANAVEIIASLPCYTAGNVDQQRGRGVFEKSIQALHELNAAGFGRPGSALLLHLVYNPLGPTLPPPQTALESDYKRHLAAEFGIEFNHLFTLTNMPISRFAAALAQSGRTEEYQLLLARSFNSATVPQLMCRSLVSVGWDGRLYDCDFNQMLGMELRAAMGQATESAGDGGEPLNLWNIDSFEELAHRHIATGAHCFGCTAGAGSSCGGSLL